MGKQIIRQHDGLYAIYSSNVDAVVCYDCTEDEVVDELANEERDNTARRVRLIIAMMKRGENPYFQFRKTWDEVKHTAREDYQP